MAIAPAMIATTTAAPTATIAFVEDEDLRADASVLFGAARKPRRVVAVAAHGGGWDCPERCVEGLECTVGFTGAVRARWWPPPEVVASQDAVLGFFDGVAQDVGPSFGQRALLWWFGHGVGNELTQQPRDGGREMSGVGGVVITGQQAQRQQAEL